MSSNSSPTNPPSRFKKWGARILHFLVGQSCIQFINLIIGILLLRWLPLEDYAQISVVLAFQTTVNSFVDMGFSQSIVALVGENANNQDRVGQIIQAAKSLRARLAIFGVAGTLVVFPLITWRQGWGWPSILILLLAVIGSVVVQGWGLYAAPLRMYGRINAYYSAQAIGAVARLAACAALYFTGTISAGGVACIATLSTGIQGYLFRKNSLPLISQPAVPDPAYKKEMVSYLMPLMPGLIFTALQGQIVVAITTFFGQTTNIAQVAALGRLGQIFLLLGAFNAVLVEPYIAAVPAANLAKRYLQMAAAATVLAALLCFIGFVFPQPFLWLLGPRYQGLEFEVGWSVAGSCVAYVASVLWTLNSARKWVYWWYTALYIALVCCSQIACVVLLDLSQTLGVMYFGVLSNVAVMAAHIACAIYGLRSSVRPAPPAPRNQESTPYGPEVQSEPAPL